MKKKLFIHIPKTGGITIRHPQSLTSTMILNVPRQLISPEYIHQVKRHLKGNLNLVHVRWRDVLEDYSSKHIAFAIVRNPWSRVVSRYLYGCSLGLVTCTFEQFLETGHTNRYLPFFWHRAVDGWYSQFEYVTDEGGKLRCDILRFEQLNNDVVKYFDLQSPLKPHNVHNGEKTNKGVINKKNYRIFYTEETKEMVAEWYKEDIKYFGFTFNGSATKNIWGSHIIS